MLARLGLALTALCLALLAAEATLRLGLDRSLADLAPATPATPASSRPEPRSDTQRFAATDSLYAVHEDPRVGYTLRPDADLAILEGQIRTNAVGMRVRAGPPPAADALSLVVLGDSVAFGFSVDDDEALAAQLEQQIAGMQAGSGRPVVCHTLATPSWNHQNALHFLFDHWDRYQPDIVVYVPILNDLSNTNGVYATGQLHLAPDPVAADPWLLVSHSQLVSLELEFSGAAEERAPGSAVQPGPFALIADISPESRRRYDDNAASIVELHQRLADMGARLLVVQSGQGTYAWSLTERLAQLAPALPVLFLERSVPASFTLGYNSHPSAATLGVRATWIAEELLRRAWIEPGAGAPLPEVPAAYAELKAPAYAVPVIRRQAAKARAQARSELLDTVAPASALGVRQIIAGVNLDRTLKNRALLVLAAAGPELVVQLAAIPERPDLYPLVVDVSVGDVPLGSLTVTSESLAQRHFPLPAGVSRGEPIEVLLAPRDWVVIQDRGRSELASALLVRVSCPAP